jgi:hypothetical protein
VMLSARGAVLGQRLKARERVLMARPARARAAGFSYGGGSAAAGVHAPRRVNRLRPLSPAVTLKPVTLQFWVKVASAGLLRSPSLSWSSIPWVSKTRDARSIRSRS